ncbi:MAG TPA: hypothetical protein VKB52_06290 [Rhodanobacteraceae bacterium]|nr:hypothetical protein [Rhodanobacteraceae bacterium]
MPTRIEVALVAALVVACTEALAAEPVAPAHPLDDPAAVKAAFAARIGKPVHVMQFGFGEHYSDAIVQNDAAQDEFDRYEMVPGQPMKEGTPQKSGSVDCKKKIAFADLDLAAAARVLGEARAIAAGNGYKQPENVQLGADVFCNDFGWRAYLTSETNSDAMLEIVWSPAGASPKARRLKDDGWAKVDMKSLAAGTAKAPPAAPKNEPAPTPGDGRERDFTHGIEADLARVEAKVGAPLGFKHIRVDKEQLSMDVFSPSNKKRVATYLVDNKGEIRLWREDDTIPFDCNKPFSASDVPIAQLPAMIAGAPALIPPMAQGWVKDVSIYRSGLCGAPHVYIQVEDDRGYGNVEYDQRGRLVSAEVQ